MVRALFVEFPQDPGSWLIDDQYLFGSDILVAPLFENVTERNVYLPPGEWIDYQTKQVYQGGWHKIKAGEIPVVMLVRGGAVIPHIKLAQSTMQMDWSKLELVSFATGNKAEGLIYLPGGEKTEKITLNKQNNKFSLTSDPFKGKVSWKIKSYQE